MRSARTLDLLTVVYSKELELLRLQAVSMCNRFRSSDLGLILVMVNDDDLVADSIDISWWGPLSDKVRILTRNDVGYTVGPGINGWYSQQIMKLLGCAQSTADWCMILDAKTWFVKDYDRDTFFEGDCAKFGKILVPKVFEPGQQYMESLFKIASSSHIAPGGVPFLMKPMLVRNMMDEIERITDRAFVLWFEENCYLNKNCVTEFICYSVYVHWQHGIEKFYCGKSSVSVHNLADWQVEKEFDSWYSAIHLDSAFTVSIQDRAMPLLSEEQKAKFRTYLASRGIE